MKYANWCIAVLGFCLSCWIFCVPRADGHGTDYRVLQKAKAVTAEFFYDDQEPMQYAEVLVFSPLDEKVEYQNGRTDRRGRFAFYPEASGTWKIEVRDGMGHMVRGVIDVAPDVGENAEYGKPVQDDRAAASRQASKSGKVVLGLSLMLNMVAIAYFWKNRPAIKNHSGQ